MAEVAIFRGSWLGKLSRQIQDASELLGRYRHYDTQQRYRIMFQQLS